MPGDIVVFDATTAIISAEVSVSFFTRLMNLISSYAEISFELRGHDSSHEQFPIFYNKQSGSSLTLIIRGKPIVCKYIVEKLTGYDPDDPNYSDQYDDDDFNLIDILKNKIDKIGTQDNIHPEKIHVPFITYVKDMFSQKNTFELEFAGRSYEKKRVLLYSKEKGQKLSIRISGKPEFTRSMIRHLDRFSSRIIKFLD